MAVDGFEQKPDERGVREGDPRFQRRAAEWSRSFVMVHDVAPQTPELLQALKHSSQSGPISHTAGLCSAARSGSESQSLTGCFSQSGSHPLHLQVTTTVGQICRQPTQFRERHSAWTTVAAASHPRLEFRPNAKDSLGSQREGARCEITLSLGESKFRRTFQSSPKKTNLLNCETSICES